MAARSREPYGFLGLLWRLALAGFLVLGLALAGGYAVAAYYIRGSETIAPDLLALSLEEAVEQASAEGFSVMLQGEEPSSLVDPGQVLGQRPSPGTIVKAGSTIRVTTASGP